MATYTPPPAPDPAAASGPPSPPPISVDLIEDQLRTLLDGLTPDPATPPGRGRPTIVPALALWTAVIVCVLKGCREQCAVWRRLSDLGLWDFPRFAISDQAVYHRLARDGTAALERLFTQISAALAARLAPHAATDLAPFASGVYALDETTLDQVARRLPSTRTVPKGDRQLLPGKLSALFDLRLQQFVRIGHQLNPAQNEKVAARAMIAALGRGALLLADLGYFGFRWFDDLTEQGLWWISRLRLKTSYEVIHVFYDRAGVFDGLVWLGVHRADRAKYAVRLVRFRVGEAEYAYVTNVCNPRVLPLAMIARLYARRWDIELAFRLIKQYLGLHLLWSSKTVVVLQQVWAVLILAQIVHALRVEIAARAEVDPFDVSLPLLLRYGPQYAERGRDVIAAFVTEGRRLGYIRPSRRVRIAAPIIPPAAITPVPPDLVRERAPRYANKDCSPR
jgi:hypothetical protein